MKTALRYSDKSSMANIGRESWHSLNTHLDKRSSNFARFQLSAALSILSIFGFPICAHLMIRESYCLVMIGFCRVYNPSEILNLPESEDGVCSN